MPRKLPLSTDTGFGFNTEPLRFGDLVADVYEHCGKARANGLLRLAVNARLLVFAEGQRFLIVNRRHAGNRV